MGDLFGALIALLVGLMILPLVVLAVLFGLALAGVGLALGLALALLAIVLKLIWAALPLLLIVGVLYLIFKPSTPRNREITQQ